MEDRTRPFIIRPVFHVAIPKRAKEHVRSCFKRFRENNPEFDEYLIGIKEVILERKLNYCDNILLFLNNELEPNWYAPQKCMFPMFIKLYNYCFSPHQAVDYIDKCYQKYIYLLNDKLVLDKEYEVFSKRTIWDGQTRDFVSVSLSPKEDPEDYDDTYFIDIDFCSLESHQDVDYMSDTKIYIRSRREIYEDAMMLFGYYQGNEYLNKVYRLAVEKLIKKKILREPTKIDKGYCVVYEYHINRPHTYKIR